MPHSAHGPQLLVQEGKNIPLFGEAFPASRAVGARVVGSVWPRPPSPAQCLAQQDLGTMASAVKLNNH